MPLWAYSDDEVNALLRWLNDAIYRDLLNRPERRLTQQFEDLEPHHIDLLGVGRWVHDYVRHRDRGRTDARARYLIEQEIRRIVGLDPLPEPGPDPQ